MGRGARVMTRSTVPRIYDTVTRVTRHPWLRHELKDQMMDVTLHEEPCYMKNLPRVTEVEIQCTKSCDDKTPPNKREIPFAKKEDLRLGYELDYDEYSETGQMTLDIGQWKPIGNLGITWLNGDDVENQSRGSH